jgi:CubicO group peptidase (beta-lactamase class C family)
MQHNGLCVPWNIVLAMCFWVSFTGCGGSVTAPNTAPGQGSAPAAATGLFVNAAPDAGGDATKAAAYIGWIASTGPNVTGYLVDYSVNGGVTASANVTTTAFDLTGLSAGASLSVTVTAQNASGNSAPTTPVVVTLPSPATAAQNTAYASAAAYSDSENGLAVVVFKNGQTAYTHYTNGYADTPQPLASGTKSFNCALEIFAQQDGYLTLNDNASGLIKEWGASANESQITLLDLLSLQSGLSGNAGYSPTNATNLDTYQEAVTETDSYPPGKAFIYDPLSFQNFALIFQVKTGGTYQGNGQVNGGTDPLQYLQTKLFTPLGISQNAYVWTRDDKGHPQMAGGASFAATDWLKFGQFVLQNGTWQSTRLLSASELSYCTGGYVNPAYEGYGISWWLNAHNNGTYNPTINQIPPGVTPAPGTDQIAPHAPVDMFMAAGTSNERLYIIPSLNLVVVRLQPVSAGLGTWSDDTFIGKAIGTIP